MKIYVDFDGVIIDSEKMLFEEFAKYHANDETKKMQFIKSYDWNYLLSNSEIINDSIYLLKQLPPQNISILTKVCSMDNEGIAKIKLLRQHGLMNEVILTPFQMKKSDIVNPTGNMLIDDTIHNLDDWQEKDGIPIFFNKDDKDIDGWNNINRVYKRIRRLDEILKK